jgi:hypothetical protein
MLKRIPCLAIILMTGVSLGTARRCLLGRSARGSPAVLRELEQLGLRPGTVLTIERRNSASSLSVRLGGADPIRISLDLADCISVIARAA